MRFSLHFFQRKLYFKYSKFPYIEDFQLHLHRWFLHTSVSDRVQNEYTFHKINKESLLILRNNLTKPGHCVPFPPSPRPWFKLLLLFVTTHWLSSSATSYEFVVILPRYKTLLKESVVTCYPLFAANYILHKFMPPLFLKPLRPNSNWIGRKERTTLLWI